jgi:hypothetical protein
VQLLRAIRFGRWRDLGERAPLGGSAFGRDLVEPGILNTFVHSLPENDMVGRNHQIVGKERRPIGFSQDARRARPSANCHPPKHKG